MAARNYLKVTATWPSGSPTSAPIDAPWGHMAGGILHLSGTWTDARIALDVNVYGQWNRVFDWQGGYTGVTIPSARDNGSFQCPPAWFYVGGIDAQVRLASVSGTGSAIAQTDTRTIVLELKD